MKVKTSELSGVQLDYAVAKSIGQQLSNEDYDKQTGVLWFESEHEWKIWSPSTDWSQCGPLIEKYHINFNSIFDGSNSNLFATIGYRLTISGKNATGAGGKEFNYQLATCRAVVAAKLGDEVDIPDELMEVGE